ncbi:hypothetical protein PROFUN_05227 [Planoprotostelium fungivorum]|uniref:Uncharacterized protein n=1 Tax=Planoprotostelium fungivorum TaxID=1890364 RepID=A0A2P6NRJ5_9EUKA|nr:hypothetical protein PROFUN_05227 [Planoprotostelium fungivorum]
MSAGKLSIEEASWALGRLLLNFETEWKRWVEKMQTEAYDTSNSEFITMVFTPQLRTPEREDDLGLIHTEDKREVGMSHFRVLKRLSLLVKITAMGDAALASSPEFHNGIFLGCRAMLDPYKYERVHTSTTSSTTSDFSHWVRPSTKRNKRDIEMVKYLVQQEPHRMDHQTAEGSETPLLPLFDHNTYDIESASIECNP